MTHATAEEPLVSWYRKGPRSMEPCDHLMVQVDSGPGDVPDTDTRYGLQQKLICGLAAAQDNATPLLFETWRPKLCAYNSDTEVTTAGSCHDGEHRNLQPPLTAHQCY